LLHNKKGISGPEFLVAILLVIISFMIGFAIISSFVSEMKPEEARAICRTSVAARAKAVIRGAGSEVHLTPFLCKEFKVTINAKGMTREEFLHKFMKYAVNTWKDFGEGQYAGIDNLYLGISGGNACYTYYTVMVEGLDEKISQTQLVAFLTSNNLPGTNITYFDYFEAKPSGHIFFLDDIEDRNIYRIIFASVSLKIPGSFESYWHNVLYIANANRREITTSTTSFAGITLYSSPCTFVHGIG